MGWPGTRSREHGQNIEGGRNILPTGKGKSMQRTLLASLAILVLGAAPALAAKNPVVVMETSMGTIKIELFEDKAPITVKNFLSYVADKHYDGLLFHRVIPGFMIQGGGMEPGLIEKKTKEPIVNESNNGVSNARGTIAMARTRAANSATSQFFISVVDNSRLDKAKYPDGVGYCAFGKVIDGMDVVDKIRRVRTTSKGDNDDVPVEDVIIKSVRVQE
jgi:peptidyl-prolyl cis-trans isomerase B (cyclophilin B)